MPCCTYLSADDWITPTRNTALNETLATVRQLTGRDWRVGEIAHRHRSWFRTKETVLYELVVGTVGPEFQVINFYRNHDWSINLDNSPELIVAYLYGVIAGVDAERKEGGR